MKIRWGDLLLVDLEPVVGHEQGRTRPVVVIQNDILNRYSSTMIVAPITSRSFSREFPTNVFIEGGNFGLNRDSTILTSQIRTIDFRRIVRKLGELDVGVMRKIDAALGISLGL